MRLYQQNGQRALALRQFESCRDMLRAELDISPMVETIRLYRKIAENTAVHTESPVMLMTIPSEQPITTKNQDIAQLMLRLQHAHTTLRVAQDCIEQSIVLLNTVPGFP